MVSRIRTSRTGRLSRARQRGAAVFVVLLVVTMLTAVGIFATRSASLTVANAGYTRQAMQNHYVTDYGMLSAITELGSTRAPLYIGAALDGGPDGDTCAANLGLAPDAGSTCTHVKWDTDVQPNVQTYYSGRTLIDAPSLNPDAGTMQGAGSLGPGGGQTGLTALTGKFDVEVTDVMAVPTPIQGQQLNPAPSQGTSNRKYYSVTMTAHGAVLPVSAAVCDSTVQAATIVAGNETQRAVVTVGPVTSN